MSSNTATVTDRTDQKQTVTSSERALELLDAGETLVVMEDDEEKLRVWREASGWYRMKYAGADAPRSGTHFEVESWVRNRCFDVVVADE